MLRIGGYGIWQSGWICRGRVSLRTNLSSRVCWSPPLAVCALCFGMTLMSIAWAQPATYEAVETYDIPAQALVSALKEYIRVSRAQVLYETMLTDGRRSQAVVGRFTSEAALQTLLAGSGLLGERTQADSYVVKQSGLESSVVARVPDMHFLGALQNGVLRVLCGGRLARPGSYSAAIALWIVPSGAIQRVSLIGSTGSATRDALLETSLQGRAIGVPPPVDIPQPFILSIVPRPPQETGDCGG